MGKKGKKNKGQAASAAAGQPSSNIDKDDETESKLVSEDAAGASQGDIEDIAKTDGENTIPFPSPSDSELQAINNIVLPVVEPQSDCDTKSDPPDELIRTGVQDHETNEAPSTPARFREEPLEASRRSPGRDSVNSSSYDFADDEDEWAWDDDDAVDANHELLAFLEEVNIN